MPLPDHQMEGGSGIYGEVKLMQETLLETRQKLELTKQNILLLEKSFELRYSQDRHRSEQDSYEKDKKLKTLRKEEKKLFSKLETMEGTLEDDKMKLLRRRLRFTWHNVQQGFIKLGSSVNNERNTLEASIYVTAVFEKLSSCVLERAIAGAQEAAKDRIVPQHIQMAIRQEPELMKIFSSTDSLQNIMNAFLDSATASLLNETKPKVHSNKMLQVYSASKDHPVSEVELARLLLKIHPLIGVSREASVFLLSLLRELFDAICLEIAKNMMTNVFSTNLDVVKPLMDKALAGSEIGKKATQYSNQTLSLYHLTLATSDQVRIRIKHWESIRHQPSFITCRCGYVEPLQFVMDSAREKFHLEKKTSVLVYSGVVLRGEETPEELSMEDAAEIYALPSKLWNDHVRDQARKGKLNSLQFVDVSFKKKAQSKVKQMLQSSALDNDDDSSDEEEISFGPSNSVTPSPRMPRPGPLKRRSTSRSNSREPDSGSHSASPSRTQHNRNSQQHSVKQPSKGRSKRQHFTRILRTKNQVHDLVAEAAEELELELKVEEEERRRPARRASIRNRFIDEHDGKPIKISQSTATSTVTSRVSTPVKRRNSFTARDNPNQTKQLFSSSSTISLKAEDRIAALQLLKKKSARKPSIESDSGNSSEHRDDVPAPLQPPAKAVEPEPQRGRMRNRSCESAGPSREPSAERIGGGDTLQYLSTFPGKAADAIVSFDKLTDQLHRLKMDIIGASKDASISYAKKITAPPDGKLLSASETTTFNSLGTDLNKKVDLVYSTMKEVLKRVDTAIKTIRYLTQDSVAPPSRTVLETSNGFSETEVSSAALRAALSGNLTLESFNSSFESGVQSLNSTANDMAATTGGLRSRSNSLAVPNSANVSPTSLGPVLNQSGSRSSLNSDHAATLSKVQPRSPSRLSNPQTSHETTGSMLPSGPSIEDFQSSQHVVDSIPSKGTAASRKTSRIGSVSQIPRARGPTARTK
eukprot:GILJ01005115.1.p1 GENE.GILJ01005115.1~~GILJ01005115.1.p1  ORF type:complete len:982 (+),score=159.08 GILJ01005115.1:164-3109(+)